MVKAHLLRIVLFGFVFGAIAFGISLLIPPKYEGIAQILIDQKNIQTVVPVTAAETAVADVLEFSRPRSIVTSVQQLTSIEVLGRAAEATVSQLGLTATQAQELSFENLRESIAIDAEAGSDFIALRVRLGSPELAREMARNIYLAFEDTQNQIARSAGAQARESLQAQMEQLEIELKQVDEQVRRLRETSGTPNLDARISSEVGGLADLDRAVDTARIELAAAQNAVRVLEEALRNTVERVQGAESEQYNQVLQNLDTQISLEEANLRSLEERFFPDRPEVMEAQARLRELRQQRQTLSNRILAATTTERNPVRSQLESQLVTARSNAEALSGRLAAAEQARAERDARVQELPGIQRELAGLVRRQAALERTYATYQDRLQSVLLSGRGRSAPTKLIGVGVLEEPVSPKPIPNAFIAFVAGSLIGLLVSLRHESRYQPIRSIVQLNALAHRPVYRMLPKLANPYRGLQASPPEAYETLVMNAIRSERRPYRVGIVGLGEDTGASTAALNYALSCSRRGVSTALLILDRKSSAIRRLSLDATRDWDLAEPAPNLKAGVVSTENLIIGQAGRPDWDQRMSDLGADVVVFDFEPTKISADYAFVAPLLDEMIVLVRAHKVRSVDFLTVQDALLDSGCPVVTPVMARADDFDVSYETTGPAALSPTASTAD